MELCITIYTVRHVLTYLYLLVKIQTGIEDCFCEVDGQSSNEKYFQNQPREFWRRQYFNIVI